MTVDPDILEELEGWAEGSDSEGDSECDDNGDGQGGKGGGAGDDEPEADPNPDEAGDGELGGSGDPTGELVLVATPIGNLGDLSPRAVEVLSTADVIYCEDTRHSRKLLTHAGISGVRLRSLHQHNEADRIDEVIGSVAGGRTVAVISDAGTPGISDPGSRVVAAAATAGLKISIVPGPSAGLAALVTSGLATDRFCFDGFLPRSGKERRQRLAALADETRTTVLFEAPTRLAGTLADLADGLGDQRQVAVARELTKLHEEIWRGNAAGAAAWAASKPMRGEVVIVVAGAVEAPAVGVGDGPLQDALEVRLARGERTRGAVDAVAEEFGVARRRVYDLALAVRNATSSPGVEKDGS